MQLHSLHEQKNLYVVSVIGEDRVGIVSEVTGLLFKRGMNIIDIEQTVIHSQFTMVLLLQPVRRQFRLNPIRKELQHLGERRGMNITVTPLHEFRGLRLAETKKPYVLTIVGSDRPGVVRCRFLNISQTSLQYRTNQDDRKRRVLGNGDVDGSPGCKFVSSPGRLLRSGQKNLYGYHCSA